MGCADPWRWLQPCRPSLSLLVLVLWLADRNGGSAICAAKNARACLAVPPTM